MIEYFVLLAFLAPLIAISIAFSHLRLAVNKNTNCQNIYCSEDPKYKTSQNEMYHYSSASPHKNTHIPCVEDLDVMRNDQNIRFSRDYPRRYLARLLSPDAVNKKTDCQIIRILYLKKKTSQNEMYEARHHIKTHTYRLCRIWIMSFVDSPSYRGMIKYFALLASLWTTIAISIAFSHLRQASSK